MRAMHLFVYGSLRTESPHPLAVKLRTQGRLLGKGSAPGILYDLGRYPAAMFGTEHDGRVIGEIFELPCDGRLLRELDYFEGTEEPASPLSRIEIDVLFEEGSSLRLETYSLSAPPPIRRVIESGDWIAHNLNRSRILR
ncbi:MAG TPA: gamma-glutamylcyclotransferase family protein [Methyloceanibacter sp.]|jgi:gamma-glutamylcyclotransferase (GGCT)/AIG2-like uncharacterized protein YtfP